MQLPNLARTVGPALAGLALAAYALADTGLGSLVFRGSLEPGSQAFWLALLLAAAGLAVLLGSDSRPVAEPTARRPSAEAGAPAHLAVRSQPVPLPSSADRRRAA